MRKITIFLLFVFIAFGASAQKRVTKVEKARSIEDRIALGTNTTTANKNLMKDPDGILIGGSANVYGVMLSGPHQLMVNNDLNLIAFGHRGIDNGNQIRVDYSVDGGATWVTEAVISTPASPATGNRYPSITISNPTGNTNLANARFVGTAPCLTSLTGSWGFTSQVDATINQTPVTKEWYGSINGDNTDFHPYHLEAAADGSVWSISTKYVASEDPANNEYFMINKGVWNSTQGKIVWTSPIKKITPAYYTEGTTKLASGYTIACHPTNPNIVYAVLDILTLSDVTNFGMKVPYLHAYKTVDGGTNWTELSPFNWSTFATQLEEYIIYNEGEEMKPYIADVDASVDANGKLHVLCEVYSGAPDLGYIYSVFANDGTPTRHYIDFSTTDGTTWDMLYIDNLESEEAPWGDVETYQHTQISRSADGKHIFYNWNETYQDPDSLNKAPNQYLAGWNINGDFTPKINLTEGTGAADICFFPQTSPVVINRPDLSTDTHTFFEMPIVIAYIDFSGGAPTEAVEYLYLKDYTVGVPKVPTAQTIVSKPEIIMYPNPVTSKLFISSNVKVELFNLAGVKLLTLDNTDETKIINMEQYPAGSYIVKAYTEQGVVTKKVICVK